MEKFDVQFISDDIINGEPLATAIVTCENLYLATFRYNYFTGGFKDMNHVPYYPVIEQLFGDEYSPSNYDHLLAKMRACVKAKILSL